MRGARPRRTRLPAVPRRFSIGLGGDWPSGWGLPSLDDLRDAATAYLRDHFEELRTRDDLCGTLHLPIFLLPSGLPDAVCAERGRAPRRCSMSAVTWLPRQGGRCGSALEHSTQSAERGQSSGTVYDWRGGYSGPCCRDVRGPPVGGDGGGDWWPRLNGCGRRIWLTGTGRRAAAQLCGWAVWNGAVGPARRPAWWRALPCLSRPRTRVVLGGAHPCYGRQPSHSGSVSLLQKCFFLSCVGSGLLLVCLCGQLQLLFAVDGHGAL